ncbi:PREDICTED: basic proline-rich protein-like [Capra hircus]|uniref:basic proline-rich protein-like n=1 Tax=Capra hircus TaxID=9925 RepID=UPI0008478085|nr:PREDICTED: basic proline-rich protein-like [Capra hircus]
MLCALARERDEISQGSRSSPTLSSRTFITTLPTSGPSTAPFPSSPEPTLSGPRVPHAHAARSPARPLERCADWPEEVALPATTGTPAGKRGAPHGPRNAEALPARGVGKGVHGFLVDPPDPPTRTPQLPSSSSVIASTRELGRGLPGGSRPSGDRRCRQRRPSSRWSRVTCRGLPGSTPRDTLTSPPPPARGRQGHVRNRAPGSRAGVGGGPGGGGRPGRARRAGGERARPCGSERAGAAEGGCGGGGGGGGGGGPASASRGARRAAILLQTQTERSGRRGSASAPTPAAATPRPAARRQRPGTGASRRPPAAVSARRPRGPPPAAGPGPGPPPTPRRPRRACESQSGSAGRRHGPSPVSSRGRRPRRPVRPPPEPPRRPLLPARPGPPRRPKGGRLPPGGGRRRPRTWRPLPEGHAVLPGRPASFPPPRS